MYPRRFLGNAAARSKPEHFAPDRSPISEKACFPVHLYRKSRLGDVQGFMKRFSATQEGSMEGGGSSFRGRSRTRYKRVTATRTC
jgi:hypothetical protein